MATSVGSRPALSHSHPLLPSGELTPYAELLRKRSLARLNHSDEGITGNTYSHQFLLLLSSAGISLGEAKIQIRRQFARLYPEEGSVKVVRLRDEQDCDLDDDFILGHVFSSGSIVMAICQYTAERSFSAAEQTQISFLPPVPRTILTPISSAEELQPLKPVDVHLFPKESKLERKDYHSEKPKSSSRDQPTKTRPLTEGQANLFSKKEKHVEKRNMTESGIVEPKKPPKTKKGMIKSSDPSVEAKSIKTVSPAKDQKPSSMKEAKQPAIKTEKLSADLDVPRSDVKIASLSDEATSCVEVNNHITIANNLQSKKEEPLTLSPPPPPSRTDQHHPQPEVHSPRPISSISIPKNIKEMSKVIEASATEASDTSDSSDDEAPVIPVVRSESISSLSQASSVILTPIVDAKAEDECDEDATSAETASFSQPRPSLTELSAQLRSSEPRPFVTKVMLGGAQNEHKRRARKHK